ncbi:MAG: efflux RND transporter periplasmic adaptor subunit [Myxococcota bacterium]|nr:efflux RND transporter periplasmic adaptor subunit [Myxococcota bacterium]
MRVAESFVAGCVALMSLGGCGGPEAHAEERELGLDVTSVVRQDIEIVREHVCQIRASQHIEVRALESGYLQEILVDEGERVEQGRHLFRILPVVYRSELALATAEMRSAQIEYSNTQMLREGNVVSPNELALAEAHLEQRAAQRSLARAHLGFATLDAPFDGIVGRLMVRRGSLVEEGDVLTILSDNRQMWVYFNVSEREYFAYRAEHDVGDPVPVRLRMANGEIFEQPGTIQTIEADFNNETGTIAFRAGFPNPGGLLRHGGTGQILTTNTLPSVLVIPQEATFTVLDRDFVFVVDEDEAVRSREITLGEELPHLYVVRDGLEEGERVLIEGLRRVGDGDRIEPRIRDAQEVLDELRNLPAE